jgi:HAE1 family hydrophobic/amphiphilic exporter-1
MDIGGREKQMQIVFDTNKLASYGLTISQVISIIQNENIDVSAGIQNINRRAYRIRTVNKFTSPADIEKVVLISTRDKKVTIKDIAKVDFGV